MPCICPSSPCPSPATVSLTSPCPLKVMPVPQAHLLLALYRTPHCFSLPACLSHRLAQNTAPLHTYTCLGRAGNLCLATGVCLPCVPTSLSRPSTSSLSTPLLFPHATYPMFSLPFPCCTRSHQYLHTPAHSSPVCLRHRQLLWYYVRSFLQQISPENSTLPSLISLLLLHLSSAPSLPSWPSHPTPEGVSHSWPHSCAMDTHLTTSAGSPSVRLLPLDIHISLVSSQLFQTLCTHEHLVSAPLSSLPICSACHLHTLRGRPSDPSHLSPACSPRETPVFFHGTCPQPSISSRNTFLVSISNTCSICYTCHICSQPSTHLPAASCRVPWV